MKQVREVVMPCSQNPCQLGDPWMGGKLQQQRSSPRNKEYKLHVELANLGILHQDNECTLKNIWLWRPVGLIFWRSQESWEIESALKGCTQNLLWSGTQSRSSNLKGARSPADLGKPPREAAGAYPGDIDTGCSNFGAPFATRTMVLASIILESSL